ncbi:MAG TPA: hypothetical protein VLA02_11325 [Reyranella sp.]|nr:hypothetical protein [Reyranella sp.]
MYSAVQRQMLDRVLAAVRDDVRLSALLGTGEAAGLYLQLREPDPSPRPIAQMPEALLDFLRP